MDVLLDNLHLMQDFTIAAVPRLLPGPLTSLLEAIGGTVLPPLHTLLNTLVHAPDLPSLAVTLLLLVASLKLVEYAVRTVFFWVRVGVRAACWLAVAGLALWCYQRGVEGFVADLVYFSDYFAAQLAVARDEAREMLEREKTGAGAGGRYGQQVPVGRRGW